MRKLILTSFSIAIIISAVLCAGNPIPESRGNHNQPALVHTVMFSLRSPVDSLATKEFLADGKRILSSIPGVNDFKVSRQVSKKNNFQFGFSMVFTNMEGFQNYLVHPLHEQFVKERWETEVVSFLEADYIPWNPQ